jgi:hypothetical protein
MWADLDVCTDLWRVISSGDVYKLTEMIQQNPGMQQRSGLQRSGLHRSTPRSTAQGP